MNEVIYSALIAFTVTVVLCPVLIPYLAKLKFGQMVRNDGPQSHLRKAGTPTMGGIVIVIGFICGSVVFVKNKSEVAAVLIVTVGFAIIGFLDDYIKIAKKRSEGLTPKQKMLGQIIVTTGFVIYILSSPNNYFGIGERGILIPFTDAYIDLKYFYVPMIYFVMIGGVNGVNFTDGLDGLNSGVTLLVSLFFVIAAVHAESALASVSGAAAGSLLGFLLFNSYPAKVFMGDTGSLALGGFVTATAIILKMPIFLAIVGMIYVIEVLSVIIQVAYFKKTKGKRFFRMAPIHHHFELMGLTETKVVSCFYIFTAVMCMIGILGLNKL